MRNLTIDEICKVSGSGGLADWIEGISDQVVSEAGDLFSGLNELGEDLGNWFYEYNHGSGHSS